MDTHTDTQTNTHVINDRYKCVVDCTKHYYVDTHTNTQTNTHVIDDSGINVLVDCTKHYYVDTHTDKHICY